MTANNFSGEKPTTGFEDRAAAIEESAWDVLATAPPQCIQSCPDLRKACLPFVLPSLKALENLNPEDRPGAAVGWELISGCPGPSTEIGLEKGVGPACTAAHRFRVGLSSYLRNLRPRGGV